MALEKILVGDDQIEYTKKVFPTMPPGAAYPDFVDNYEAVIEKARNGDYNLIVTDLNYTENGQEGYKVLEALVDLPVRKILWTGNADDPGVRERAQALGAEVLGKDEIGTLVGIARNEKRIKNGGEVMLYIDGATFPVFMDAYKRAIEGAGYALEDVALVKKGIREHLATGRYGLIIDMTAFEYPNGVVAHDLKYVDLEEIPRVVTVYEIGFRNGVRRTPDLAELEEFIRLALMKFKDRK